MCVRAGDDSTHAHLRCTLDQAICHKPVCLCNAVQRTRDGQHAVVHTRDDLADTSSDTGLVAQIRDVLACLANDHAGLLGGDNRT